MKKKIYIIRHGHTLANKYNLWNGTGIDFELTREGKYQALEAGQKLQKIALDAIYCSPLLRAYQTAIHIAQSQKKHPNICLYNDLQEINFGIAEGSSLEMMKDMYLVISDLSYWCTLDTWDYKFPGKSSESKHQAFNRAWKALFNILDTKAKNIAIVSHAGLIHSLQVGLRLKQLDYSNCAINVIEYDTKTQEFRVI